MLQILPISLGAQELGSHTWSSRSLRPARAQDWGGRDVGAGSGWQVAVGEVRSARTQPSALSASGWLSVPGAAPGTEWLKAPLISCLQRGLRWPFGSGTQTYFFSF